MASAFAKTPLGYYGTSACTLWGGSASECGESAYGASMACSPQASIEDIMLVARKDLLFAQEVYSALLAQVAPIAATLARPIPPTNQEATQDGN